MEYLYIYGYLAAIWFLVGTLIKGVMLSDKNLLSDLQEALMFPVELAYLIGVAIRLSWTKIKGKKWI